jgi:hypothetical protein
MRSGSVEGPAEGQQMSRHRGLVATLVGLAVMALAPAAAVALDDDAPLDWETTTAPSSEDATGESLLTVTDVWLTLHDGFDRVIFETEGEGEVGWFIAYVDEPASDGSGLPVPVAGSIALRVSLTGIAIPGDEPADAVTFEDDVPGLEDGVVLEIVNDTIFEGQHTFFIGLDERLPYRVTRVDDPKGLVIDLVHDADAETAPTGAVETGWGGNVPTSPLATGLGLGGVLLLAVGGSLLIRRRSPA